MLEPVRWSNLRYMVRSPAHYRHYLTHPPEATPAMRLGALVHYRVLGGTAHRFVVYDGERRGKAWAAFKAENDGAEIVTAEENALAVAIGLAVEADPVSAPLLEGVREMRLEWTVAGRACAGTPDARSPLHLTDLKTCGDAHPDRFPWYALRALYVAQMAWYLDGIAAAGLPVPGRLSIVAVEVKPPHVVTTFELTEAAIEMGRRTYRLALERLLACEAADEWPGYCQSAVPFDAPEETTLTIDGEEVTA